MGRKFYGGYSYMGTNYNYDAGCWVTYQFDSKAERDQWVSNNLRCKEVVTRATAYKITGIKKYNKLVVEEDGRMMAGY